MWLDCLTGIALNAKYIMAIPKEQNKLRATFA
jgi:hypothetical protein